MTIKITGWIATDKNNHCYLYEEMPLRSSEFGVWIGIKKALFETGTFPFLTWENSPKEVSVVINVME